MGENHSGFATARGNLDSDFIPLFKARRDTVLHHIPIKGSPLVPVPADSSVLHLSVYPRTRLLCSTNKLQAVLSM